LLSSEVPCDATGTHLPWVPFLIRFDHRHPGAT